ncbi:MAG TPA: 4-hydroxy-3-methylbut-2-enyl diphosphate reductase [Planctomycetaceae bacterium]|nr:4-hydroxy-3-methylbut-2-enyl diphosphate reductase [Planctomycetaceae bacterium]
MQALCDAKQLLPTSFWNAAMHVILADSFGLCFGVRDALSLAERTRDPQSVTIHGELVHNERVLHHLSGRGFHVTPESDRKTLPTTPRVMVTAHGISDRERGRLESAGLRLIDSTCPLVQRVHRAAQALAAAGRYVLVIGRPGHVEVQGIVEDLSDFEIVDRPEDVHPYPEQRLGIICQSTTSPRLAEQVQAVIREKNPHADIEFVDTICQPTRDRQEAVRRLLPQVDAVVVVGGRNSNNTRELAALCEAGGKPAFHVQSADDLDPQWFRDCRTVGLTAGTSTLDETIESVRNALLAM